MLKKAKKIGCCAIAIFFVFTFFSCSRPTPPAEDISSTKPLSPSKPASKKIVKFGFVPVRNVEKMTEEFVILTDYLGKKTGCQFEVYPFQTYATLLEKFITKEIDVATAGSFIAYRAIKELKAIPVARPEKDGVSFYTGLIVTRKDSGIKKLSDLKGKSFAFVDVNTSAGYVYPQFLIKSMGYNFNEFFREIRFAGRHDAAFLAVYHRQVDAAAAKNLVFKEIARDNPDFKDKMLVLAESKNFPEKPVVARADFNLELRKKLKEALINMHRDPEGRKVLKVIKVDKFIDTSLSDFVEVEKLYRELFQK